jgi:hypothetical protein
LNSAFNYCALSGGHEDSSRTVSGALNIIDSPFHKLTEDDLKASSRVCSFHFFGGERKKKDIGEKFGAESGRKFLRLS